MFCSSINSISGCDRIKTRRPYDVQRSRSLGLRLADPEIRSRHGSISEQVVLFVTLDVKALVINLKPSNRKILPLKV